MKNDAFLSFYLVKQPDGWQIVCSVLAAFFGVQSKRNQLRDFGSGKYWPYILMALFLTFLFILIVYGLVQLALTYVGN